MKMTFTGHPAVTVFGMTTGKAYEAEARGEWIMVTDDHGHEAVWHRSLFRRPSMFDHLSDRALIGIAIVALVTTAILFALVFGPHWREMVACLDTWRKT